MAFAQRVRLNAAKSGVRRSDITFLLGYLTPNGSANTSRGARSVAPPGLQKLCVGMFVFYCALLLSVCIVALANSNAGRTRLGSLSAFHTLAASRTDQKAQPQSAYGYAFRP
jgi:hypothetical protein